MSENKDYTAHTFGTFRITKILGRMFASAESSQKRTYVEVVCIKCNKTKKAMKENNCRLHTKCPCEKSKINEDIGAFIVLKDFGMKHTKNLLSKKFRMVIVQCKSCGLKQKGNYSSFKIQHRKCKCQLTPVYTPERKRIYKDF